MRDPIYYRNITQTILKQYKDSNVIKVLTGIRRCGKSSLLKLIRHELTECGVPNSCIVYLDFEDFENIEFNTVEKIYAHIKQISEDVNSRLYLLFDEIQEVDCWEKCINSLYSSETIDCDIYITGSNAKLLSSELATYISGRYVEIPIFPLSYGEFLKFNKIEDSDESFTNYMQYGGFPGLTFMNKDNAVIKSYLDGIYSTVLFKDVIRHNKIRDLDLLEKVVLYVCDNIGNIFSAKKISDFMKSMRRTLSIETIYNILRGLQNALFVYKVKRYDLNGKRILETLEKYYIADQGIRYNLLGFKEESKTRIIENIVFIELLRRSFNVTIGKIGDYEIDFIAEKQGEKQYIQICYLLTSNETFEREIRPLQMIHDNYPKMILSLDNMPDSNNDGIIRTNLRKWLLAGDN